MPWIWRILLGLAISVLGYFITWKSQAVVEMVGVSAWAEDKFGTFGGTGTLIKLLGIVAIFIGFIVMLALHEGLLGAIANLVTPGNL